MKALSLWQPHVAAIALGLKQWETRDWRTHYRGPLAMHAALRPWTEGDDWHILAGASLGLRIAQVARERFPMHDADRIAAIARIVKGQVLAFGAVICFADLVDCVPTSTVRGKIDPAVEFWGDFSDGETGAGRYAFRLENVRLLARPVPWKGAQGFFEVELGQALEEATAQAWASSTAGQALTMPAAPAQLDLFGGF